MENKQRIRVGEKIEVLLSEEDRDLILEHTFVDREQERLLRFGVLKDGQIAVRMTLDDLDDVLGHVAFTANHAENLDMQKTMEAVYDRLKVFEDMYVEEE